MRFMSYFNGKGLCMSINPNEAVAYGAAMQAALLTQGIKNVPDLVLLDVMSLSLENLTSVQINVYEGERTRASDNNLLGFFSLSGFPPTPQYHPFDICFDIDVNGILSVSAEEKTTGYKNDIAITNDQGKLSAEEIKRMIEKAETYQAEDNKFLRKANAMNALDDYIYKMKTILKKDDISLKLCSQERQKISFAVTKATNLLHDDKQQNEAVVFEDSLKELAI
ncbi:Heat shock cognate 70 kDa protein 2 [Glycine soja]|uniref:Heat shock cognate 70 kDa protein 2 n=1 Tax=Glycine soja TaxID=3848 RepID=A0A445LLI1_GLYSO|nr:Heat shock cognate 70 kDa protein 2 [Glycine soja]